MAEDSNPRVSVQERHEEHRQLRQELNVNRRFVFERPIVIAGVGLAGYAGLSDKLDLRLLPVPILALLLFNLWFTYNRLLSNARIISYIQLVHDPNPRSSQSWVGWKTALDCYRTWFANNSDAWRECQKECSPRRDSMGFYTPIFWFHVSIGTIFCAFVVLSRLGSVGGNALHDVVIVADMISFVIYLILAFCLWPSRVKSSVEVSRCIWEKVFENEGISKWREEASRRRVMVDRALRLKVAFFNAVGLLVAIGSPAVFDPLLTTHVQFGARHYPYVGWLLLLCPVAFVGTYFSLTKRAPIRNPLVSILWVAIPGIGAAFAFPPERPHFGVLTWTFGYCLLSFLTVFFRQSRDGYLYLEDPDVPFDSKLERLKATISTWQQLTIYSLAGYLAFVIFQISIIWTISQVIVTAQNEKFLFGELCGMQIAIFSVFVIMGPLNEAFQMTLCSTRKLSTLRKTL